MMCSSLKISVIYIKDNLEDKVESKEKQPLKSVEVETSGKDDTKFKENAES